MSNKKYDSIKYYNENSKMYFDQTVDVDLTANCDKFLELIPEKSYILDFGCGSGRDSKYFLKKGYRVEAIDGSIEMCKLASEFLNQEVKCMTFDELEEENKYDGIWACGSIQHVEKEDLPNILKKMIRALKPEGIIYAGFKKGETFELKEGKYYNLITKDQMEDIIDKFNLKVNIVEYFETRSVTKRSDKYTWVNFLLQKQD